MGNDARPEHALAVGTVCAARHYKRTGAHFGGAVHHAVRAGYRSAVNYDRTHAWKTWRTMAEVCWADIEVVDEHSGDAKQQLSG